SLAFDAFGNLFMTYLVYNGSRLPVALSTDGGVSFDLIASIIPKVAGLPLASRGHARISFPDQPTITTGPGSVWVTFTGGARIQAAGAAVQGLGRVGPFSAPEVAVGRNAGHFGDIAVGPSGRV